MIAELLNEVDFTNYTESHINGQGCIYFLSNETQQKTPAIVDKEGTPIQKQEKNILNGMTK